MQNLLHPAVSPRLGRHAGRLAAALAAAFLCLAPAHAQQPAPSAAVEPADALLNSERIERRFGSYGIEVLESGPVRVSNLYSLEDGRRVCRTFAVVRYPQRVEPAFAREHEAILAGGSIGAVFAAAGWRVTKHHLRYDELDSTPRVEALMGRLPPAKLAAHVYVLRVERAGAAYDYAVIAEVHHPAYLAVEDLPAIYGPAHARGAEEEAVADAMLEIAAQKMR
ncbi:MAG TPA: hypothetical protein VF322_11185 [Gammaproteobacteria bacterium]